jgi:sulfite exporter TauE/SafE
VNLIALPILLGSLAGSLHCAAMCGPFVAAVAAPTPGARTSAGAQAAYHGGRLSIYLALGAVAGLLGGALDLAGSAAGLGRVSAVIAGVVLVLWGATQFFPRPSLLRLGRRATPRLGSLLGAVLVRFRSFSPASRALVLGFSTGLVPCGWLYAFVATAAASGHVASALGVMFAFWLGTVPALLATSLGLRGLLSRFGRHARTASASLIVLSGLSLLALRLGSAPAGSHEPGAVTMPVPCPLPGGR